MFQRETMNTPYICPTCGKKLTPEHNLFRCEEHGLFSAYGPHLLVRVPPQSSNRDSNTPMPWEPPENREARSFL